MYKAVICALLASASLAIKSSTLSSATATTNTATGPPSSPELIGEDVPLTEILSSLIECQRPNKEMLHLELEKCYSEKFEAATVEYEAD